MGTTTVIEDGILVYQKSIGVAKLPKSKPDSNTQYRIGSISKTYTSTVILQMIEEGKISLNTTIGRYFKDIPNANRITIEHLLYHRSGLFNLTEEDGFSKWIQKPRFREDILAKIKNNGTNFDPGLKKEYANTNYILLSYIAEDVDNMAFEKVLQTRIFTPLRLERTNFGGQLNPSSNQALSYYRKGNVWERIPKETYLNATMGAGGIVSTSKEVAFFYHSLFSGKLLTKESLKLMTTPKDEMGMGISVVSYNGLIIYGHDGGIDGYTSIAFYIPELKLATCMTFNASTENMTETAIQFLQNFMSSNTSR
ncbi:serine hydrolase [Tenacibaculum sp. SG-28]|uniref:serine hydrolase domain-containing protein n=1 Tax=Tenacibaculum sp. SG-28 TaxID=754426 RepID=UPI0013048DB5|nr:serine hydrolase domain-containing protein [Tenacibaculum sp. SG-28]